MRDVYNWDTGVYLGQIKEATETFNVVGNMNQFGLVIGETTYGGIAELQVQSKGLIDYGSLIWITLQRSKTAREAIATIGSLLAEYGYVSEGESFSIADPTEAWVMEIIGKGEFELGAVWVAKKVPAGHVTAHANQARITTFAPDDDTLFAPDTVSFAKKYGFYPKVAPDAAFSFSDTYNPVSFEGARFCEARVWSFFGAVMGADWAAQYLDYAQGYNLTNRMPLFVAPPKKLSLDEVFSAMRSHYEGTELDMTGSTFSDVGAAFGGMAQRAHPLTWTSQSAEYLNERPIGTPQTGWNFVAQSRRWMPAELAGLLWFGVDDSSTTAHFPIYGSCTSVPQSFAGKGAQDGVTPPIMTFNMQTAFTAFNLVANWAYSRWDLIYPDVLARVLAVEAHFQQTIMQLDKEALQKYETEGASAAVAMVTLRCGQFGDSLVQQWGQFFGELFVKYRDGYVISASEESQNCGCKVANGAYPQQWLDRIVGDTQEHYKVPSEAQLLQGQGQGQGPRGNGGVRDSRKLELLSRR